MVVGDFPIELDTVVIGSGPGGYVAAIRASQMGKRVAVIEKDKIGGVCLNVGCIPSKALITAGHKYQEALHSAIFGVHAKEVSFHLAETQQWKDTKVVATLTKGVEALLKKNSVQIIRGSAFFVDAHHLRVMTDDSFQTYTYEHAILATGSRPIEIKGFPFGKRVLDSTGALSLSEVPNKMVVIGGGYIGCELAGAYANFGTDVTIIEHAPAILPNFERDMAKLVEANFKKKGVALVTEATAKGAVDNGGSVTVTYEAGGKEHSIEADYVMVTVGRRPNTDELGLEYVGVQTDSRGLVQVDEQCRASKDNIYAIGDIVPGPALAHKASFEAKIVGEVIGGKNVAVDYKVIPAVCFTDPELATVGLTVEEAKAQGFDAAASKFPLAGNGRALSLHATEGFVRLVTDKATGELLGAQVAGAGASDVIAEMCLAIELGVSAEDIALTIHAHPTIAEAVMDASELALGMPIHV